MQIPIGRHLDDPDTLFNWLHAVVIGVPVLHFSCRSGMAERLLQGPASLPDLAEVVGLDLSRTARFVDYLIAHELAERAEDGRVAAHGRMERVVANAGLWQQMINTQWAASALDPALRHGLTAFEEQFGAPVFSYFAEKPEAGALFAEFMSFMTARTIEFVLAKHRFAPFETVVDVGGSHGAMLLRVLGEYPGTKGVLFDLPGVVEQAEATIAASPQADRVQTVGGSFFETMPEGDLYLLKQILHDWSDGECVRILQAVRRAILPDGRVAVIDHLLSQTPEPSEAQSTDIAMMVWATGRERKRAEFEALFAQAGFRLNRVTPNPNGHSVIEAVPV